MDSIEEIKKEYKNFLKDTGKKDNKKTKDIFKKEFLTWFVELFGINDGRTKNTVELLKEL